MFLVGKGIPERITSLPQTVLRTPFGQMLKPQLDSAMRSMTQAPLPPSTAPAARAVQSRPTSMTNGATERGVIHQTNGSVGTVRNVSSLNELDLLLKRASTKCAVIFFTSATCPPCKILYPPFDELAAEAGDNAIFIKVDVSKAYDIGRRYGITATPTFMTFMHGEKENEWKGADQSRLRGNVGLLLQMARHPHLSLHLPNLLGVPSHPVTYSKIPPLDKLIAKMGDAGQDPSVLAIKEFVTVRNSEGAEQAPLPDLRAFGSFVQRCLRDLPEDLTFAVVDLLRVTLVDPRVSGYFAEESDHLTIATLLDHVVNNTSSSTPGTPRPYALRLVALQTLCNAFTSPLFARELLTNPSLTSATLDFLAANLPDHDHTNIRITAASLAFNIAVFNHQTRTTPGTAAHEPLPEGDQLQLLAALVEAVSAEKESAEALRRLLLALGFLVHCAPRDGAVLDYVRAVDAAGVVKAKKQKFSAEKLVGEVGGVLLAEGC